MPTPIPLPVDMPGLSILDGGSDGEDGGGLLPGIPDLGLLGLFGGNK